MNETSSEASHKYNLVMERKKLKSYHFNKEEECNYCNKKITSKEPLTYYNHFFRKVGDPCTGYKEFDKIQLLKDYRYINRGVFERQKLDKKMFKALKKRYPPSAPSLHSEGSPSIITESGTDIARTVSGGEFFSSLPPPEESLNSKPLMQDSPFSYSHIGQMTELEFEILSYVIKTGIPFSHVDKPSFKYLLAHVKGVTTHKEVVSFLKKLPSSQRIKTLLRKFVKNRINLDYADDIRVSPRYLSLALDGWLSNSLTDVIGFVVMYHPTSEKGYVIREFTSGEIMEGKSALHIANQVEKFINTLEANCGKIISVVITDQASANIKAKEILSKRFPYIKFMPCMAHQINLIICRLYKEEMKDFVDEMCLLLRKIKASKFNALLKHHCFKLYGKTLQLRGIAETRWNSAYLSIVSFTMIRSALLEAKDEYYEIMKKAKVKPIEDYKKLNAEFFEQCRIYGKILEPLYEASLQMQTRKANVGLALSNLLELYSSFDRIKEDNKRNILQWDLHYRWHYLDQALFFWGFGLNVKNLRIFKKMLTSLSEEHKVELFNEIEALHESSCLDQVKYKKGDLTAELNEFFYSISSPIRDIDTNISNDTYWGKVKEGSFSVIAEIALFLDSLKCQTASCERLFSDYQRQKSKTRNRLKEERMFEAATAKQYLNSNIGEKKKSRGEHVVGNIVTKKKYTPKKPKLVELPIIDKTYVNRFHSQSLAEGQHSESDASDYNDVILVSETVEHPSFIGEDADGKFTFSLIFRDHVSSKRRSRGKCRNNIKR